MVSGCYFLGINFGAIPLLFSTARGMVQLLNNIETKKLELPIQSKKPSKNAVDLLFKLLNKNPDQRIKLCSN